MSICLIWINVIKINNTWSKNMELNIPDKIFDLPKNSFVIGGAVRDKIMNREPGDIDITTEATPDELLKLFPDATKIGVKFGTIAVGGIEITTMREDVTSGRHPEVKFINDIVEDMKRRDFTMNAMAIPLHDLSLYNIIDVYRGRESIENKIIVAVGDPIRKIKKDQLIALRAVRFASQLDFRIAPSLKAAIRNNYYVGVSMDKTRIEILKSFEYNSKSTIINLMDTDLIKYMLHEIIFLIGREHEPKHHPEGDAFAHTMKCLEYADDYNYSPIQKLATLLHDMGKTIENEHSVKMKYPGHAKLGLPIASEMLKKLNFSNSDKNEILFAIENHMRLHVISDMKKSKRYRLYESPYFETLLRVHQADCDYRNNSNVEFINGDYNNMIVNRKQKPFVNGHDLISIGYRPNKQLGETLDLLYQFQVNGLTDNREEALVDAKRFLKTD